MRNQLLYYALKYQGDYERIHQAFINQEEYEKTSYEGTYICIGDQEYPLALKELKKPPYILFYEGDISLLTKPMISVVGARNITPLGKRYCDELMCHLNHNYVVVSGMAKGVDGYIHKLALHYHKSIGVVGSGLNVCYPKENTNLYINMRKKGLIISEYPQNVQPCAHHFPMRNRIIAALGSKLIVIECTKRSGTMLTVNDALDLNRDIYCFPYPFLINKPSGCNLMIQEGASVLVDKSMLKEL